jgi:hypothetical protein
MALNVIWMNASTNRMHNPKRRWGKLRLHLFFFELRWSIDRSRNYKTWQDPSVEETNIMHYIRIELIGGPSKKERGYRTGNYAIYPRRK